MRKWLSSLLAVILMLSVSSQPLHASGSATITDQVSIEVLDENNQPISDATVLIWSVNDGAFVQTARTNKAGKLVFRLALLASLFKSD